MNKPLTTKQLTLTFGSEGEKICQQVICDANKALKPYHAHVKRIRNKYHDPATQRFLVLCCRVWYKPEEYERRIRDCQKYVACLNEKDDDSNRITSDMVERAKDVPIIRLAEFANIKPSRGKWTACCPLHNEKTPSFHCYPGNTFYCFGCHSGGDSIAFVQKMYDMPFPDAVRYILSA